MWVFFLGLLVTFELIADFFSKEYSLKGYWLYWGIAILSYVVANIFWLSAMKSGSGLIRGANIFSVGSAVCATVLGYYVFHEEITRIQIVGVIMGMCAIVLLFSE